MRAHVSGGGIRQLLEPHAFGGGTATGEERPWGTRNGRSSARGVARPRPMAGGALSGAGKNCLYAHPDQLGVALAVEHAPLRAQHDRHAADVDAALDPPLQPDGVLDVDTHLCHQPRGRVA